MIADEQVHQMTDYDRGAYTPQPDAPLQFDARGPRGRKPMPMTLIGSGAVLLVLLGALALHYRHDTKPSGDSARPVGEPIAQVKAAAPAAAQPKDTIAGLDVFGGAKSSTTTPTFIAAPEAPKPRAQLTIQAAEPLSVKSAPIATTNPTMPLSPAKAVPAPVAVTKVSPSPKVTSKQLATGYIAPNAAAVATPNASDVIAKVAAAPVAKPPLVVATAPKTSAVAAKAGIAATKTAAVKPVTGGSALVQIGAFSSTAQSDKGWADVSAVMGGDMSGKSKRVETLDKDGQTLYRTSVAGFSNRSAADAFCKALAAKGHICFAKG